MTFIILIAEIFLQNWQNCLVLEKTTCWGFNAAYVSSSHVIKKISKAYCNSKINCNCIVFSNFLLTEIQSTFLKTHVMTQKPIIEELFLKSKTFLYPVRTSLQNVPKL